MKSLFKKIAVLLIALSISVTGVVPSYADSKDFDAFLDDEWKELMESDYMTMHASVKDYKALGLTKPKVDMGDITYEEIAKEVSDAQESLDKLHEFDFDSLDETQQYDYLVYEDYLEKFIGVESYPEYIEMFRPITGSFTLVKDYMLDFALHTQEDLDDYITLLEDFPRVIDQMIAFTEQQAEKGYMMDDTTLDEAIGEIDDFVEAGEDNEMIVVFDNNLEAEEWIDDATREKYSELNRRIVLDKIIPAYEKAADAIDKLHHKRSAGKAVCSYPDGAEYYKWYSDLKCSSDEPMQDKFDYLTRLTKDVSEYYEGLIEANPDFEEPATIEGLESLDEVIEYLRNHMDGFPEGPKVDHSLAYLDESVSESAMAYYMQSPVDDINENIIHVNKDAVDDINTLYYTLAHEGYPGHLYQLTWYQNQEHSRLRHDLSMIGYEEGWANYVERIMLLRSGLDNVSAEVIACDEFMSYMTYAGADIAVNGLGYSIKELSSWLEEVGLDRSYVSSIYDYVVSYPGLLLPYGYGMARFWDLRCRTEAALGDDFDLEEFHLQLLTNGSRPFDMVEKDVREYVESKGHELPGEVKLFAGEDLSDAGSGSGSDKAAAAAQDQNQVRYILIAAAVIVLLAVILLVVMNRRRKKQREEAARKEALARPVIRDESPEAGDETAETYEFEEPDDTSGAEEQDE
ncbi:MAG: DUF885 domain-containing protein [Mogibacterium sp.]|nr:DUF885 domain-containing protein [Mogibacterium sp.]